MSKGASLLPQDFAVGGALPDGDYTMKSVVTSTFDYQGKSETAPALHVTFVDGDNVEYEQYYSAGKLEFLSPSEDGKRFVHPSGGDAKISKSSNCAQFIASLLTAGFPTAGLSDDVSAFAGHRVTITNIAQPKRPGLKDEKEGKTIPVVTKYLGEAKGAARGAAKPRATTPAQTAASTASSPTSQGTNGQAGPVDDKAIATLQTILSEAPENTIVRGKAATTAMLRLSKAKDPDMAAVKKLIENASWLQNNAEKGGWVSDGETILLG